MCRWPIAVAMNRNAPKSRDEAKHGPIFRLDASWRMGHDWRMFKYHQYCPVARACEILSDRWTPLIVRELLLGSGHFNDLRRGLPHISRSLLVARLRHLEENGV